MSIQPVSHQPLISQHFFSKSAPAEIIEIIFSYLSYNQQIVAMKTCKSWYTLFSQRIRIHNSPAMFSLLFFKGTWTKLYLSIGSKAHQLMLINSNTPAILEEDCLRILKPNDCFEISHAQHFLCQNEQFLLMTSKWESEKNFLICIDRGTCQLLFKLNVADAIENQEERQCKLLASNQKIMACQIISQNPLTFLTVTSGGTIATWKFNEGKIFCEQTRQIFKKETFQTGVTEVNYSKAFKTYFFVFGTDIQTNRCVTKFSLCYHFYTKQFKFYPGSLQSTFRTKANESDLFYIRKERNRYAFICLKAIETVSWIWYYREPDAFLEFLTEPDSRWAILKNKTTVLCLSLIEKKLHYTFNCDKKIHFAKLMDPCLLIAVAQKILIYNLETRQQMLDLIWRQGIHIVDCILDKDRFFLLSRQMISKRESFKVDVLKLGSQQS